MDKEDEGGERKVRSKRERENETEKVREGEK